MTGDMADYTLDAVEDFEAARLAWRTGHMGLQSAIDQGVLDEHGYEFTPSAGKSITCRCCKIGGMHWEKYKGKWRLFDKDGLHICKVNPLQERGVL